MWELTQSQRSSGCLFVAKHRCPWLHEKTRNGSAVVKRYSLPFTPCDRVISHEAVGAGTKAALAERRATLDPVPLLHTIREAQSALVSTVSPELGSNPRVESLERFLTRLPDRWLEEQENAGRKQRVRAPLTWRTRKDPFEGVWCKVLGWLEEDPNASVVVLLERLEVARDTCDLSELALSTDGLKV